MMPDPIIGSSISRKDGENKVTGKTRFGADYSLPGQLYAAVYHSPHAHARILSLDTEKARTYPGVRAVITGEDCPGYYGSFICDQPILAHDKVVYKGQPVAAVAADTERIAREAVRLIEAEYELLPIVDSIEDAIKAAHLEDLSDLLKVRNFYDVMGYVGYVSGREEDRRKLYITDIYPVKRKKDGKQFGYSITTKSIGSGIESRFTIYNRDYEHAKVGKGDIIYCTSYERDKNGYFRMKSYRQLF